LPNSAQSVRGKIELFDGSEAMLFGVCMSLRDLPLGLARRHVFRWQFVRRINHFIQQLFEFIQAG